MSSQDKIVEEELDTQINEELDKAIDEMTLFDDDLMSKVFEKNIPATELLLRIILERDDIKVISVAGQETMKSPYPKGRSITLDILARNRKGDQFNVEVQRNTRGSNDKRARFHESMMTTRMLKEKQDFKKLKESYVIFICQHDKFKLAEPVYHIDRIVRETGEAFQDGSHIIYVNGKYRGNDDFGKLAHDFNCKKASNIHFKPLADGVRHFKETEEGREEMCESFEKLANKRAEQRAEQVKISDLKALMSNLKLTLDEALDALEVKGKERAIIAKQLQA